MKRLSLTLALLLSGGLMAGCEALGIETATQINAKKEAEARAIGSACRHAVRSIEDCFNSNPRAGKAAVFAGWKDMDQYMRENEIVGMPSERGPSRTDPALSDDSERSPERASERSSRS
ncbi:MAG TPA: hypothetical protein PKC60_00315 [Hydrogenophaga sp.]|uniref:hypothetical protein n=1 Tax=Hydrogenophaga sp. TaxID=1904254 RepID=UPI002D0F01B4|nr:hypothetical protein [Hydrogenophaga sp.]HMN91648.1 hypothetical protein [Hydrogenophaga sp.]HMP09980.1 hypothetical protein [Hydrogenophaga sp.]